MIRPAEDRDIEAIVAMTRAARRNLARWSPVFFHPAPNVDERHAQYLALIVRSSSYDTRVAVTDDSRTAAFGVVIEQPTQFWLDDLCVSDPEDWNVAGAALIKSVTNIPTVTCVSPKDRDRLDALHAAGFVSVSSYWARILSAHSGAAVTTRSDNEIPLAPGPIHSFGGALDPTAPGALTLTTSDGYVVGSASTTPPVYDPGGPTCVIDRIVGVNRRRLLDDAMSAAAHRGDHQLLVIASDTDAELLELLRTQGFEQHVLVLARR
jgi:hypothetical protein